MDAAAAKNKSLALAKALAKHGYALDACVEELQRNGNDINKAATALILRFGPPVGLNAAPEPTASEAASVAPASASQPKAS